MSKSNYNAAPEIVDTSGFYVLSEDNGVWRLWRMEKSWERKPTDAELGALIDINYAPPMETTPEKEEKFKPSGDFIDKF